MWPSAWRERRWGIRVSGKKFFFWPCKLARKYKVTCHARNTLTKDGGSPLSFVPRPSAPKRSAGPIERSKIQKCRTKLIVCSFESSWREKQTWAIHNTLLPIFWKIQTKNKMAVIVVYYPVNISKSFINRAFRLIESLSVSSRAFRMSIDEVCTTILKLSH